MFFFIIPREVFLEECYFFPLRCTKRNAFPGVFPRISSCNVSTRMFLKGSSWGIPPEVLLAVTLRKYYSNTYFGVFLWYFSSIGTPRSVRSSFRSTSKCIPLWVLNEVFLQEFFLVWSLRNSAGNVVWDEFLKKLPKKFLKKLQKKFWRNCQRNV